MYRKQIGVATLEVAAYMAVLISLALSGYSLIDWLRISNSVGNALDKAIYDTGISPLRLANNSGSFDVLVNSVELQGYIADVLSAAEEEMDYAVGSRGLTAEDYYIEARYAVIDIDTETGEALGIESESLSQVTGGFSAPSGALSETDLSALVESYVENSTVDSRFLYATPTVMFSGDSSGEQFLSKAVVVVARALVAPPQGAARHIISQIQSEPVVKAVKIITLRGELEL